MSGCCWFLLEVAGGRIELQEPVDGLGRLAGRFRHAFGRPAGRRSQHALHLLGLEDFQDAADERGLADARPARDDEHLLLARLPDRLLLPRASLIASFPSTQPMAFSTSMTGMGCGVAEAIRWTRLGQAHLGPVQGSQVEPGFAFDGFPDDRLFGHRGFHRRFDDQLVDLDQLRGVFDNAGLWVSDVALAGQVLERVLDGGPGPIGTVAVDPHLGRQFIGGLEADAPDVVGEPVGVFLDLGDGFLAVGAVDSHGPTEADAMLGQEEHDLADFLLLLPALTDPLDSFVADALDVEQEIGGRLEDFEGPFLVDADDLGRQLRPDAANAPGGQILFDALGRGRVRGLEFVGLELLAVFSVNDPLAGGFQMLASRNRSRAAHDRHQVLTALDLHLEDGEAVLWVVVGDSLDEAGESFGHGGNGATGVSPKVLSRRVRFWLPLRSSYTDGINSKVRQPLYGKFLHGLLHPSHQLLIVGVN